MGNVLIADGCGQTSSMRLHRENPASKQLNRRANAGALKNATSSYRSFFNRLPACFFAGIFGSIC
jgi:hypothetical protein